jgi:AbrB family looped-hinge helix DNA binding protein
MSDYLEWVRPSCDRLLLRVLDPSVTNALQDGYYRLCDRFLRLVQVPIRVDAGSDSGTHSTNNHMAHGLSDWPNLTFCHDTPLRWDGPTVPPQNVRCIYTCPTALLYYRGDNVTQQAEGTIDRKYRVVIPTDAREAVGIKPGQRVLIEYKQKGRKLSMDIIPAHLVPIDE